MGIPARPSTDPHEGLPQLLPREGFPPKVGMYLVEGEDVGDEGGAFFIFRKQPKRSSFHAQPQKRYRGIQTDGGGIGNSISITSNLDLLRNRLLRQINRRNLIRGSDQANGKLAVIG